MGEAARTLDLFDKQYEAFSANTPIVVYTGGIQSGKTTLGALKSVLAPAHFNSPDDNFIIVAPNHKTLSQATLPKFLKLAGPYGTYHKGDQEFHWRTGGITYIRTATHPESIEGITNVRFVWGDESGQFSKYFWENMMGRAAFKQAQILLTTTPYALNWLADIVRQVSLGKRSDATVVQCRSIDSPYFPKSEYERQRGLLDSRRFRMKYMGIFGKMEGLVYDCLNLCTAKPLPEGTQYYAGIDWGYYPDPFVMVIRAVTPDGMHYRVGEFYKNRMTPSQIVDAVAQRHQIYKFTRIICDPSEPKMIQELRSKGRVPAVPGINDITMGIGRHYELMKRGKFWMFEDTNPYGVDEYNMYHYPEDRELKFNESRKTRDTVPVDQHNHGCDADRYVTVHLTGRVAKRRAPKNPIERPPQDHKERIERLKRRGITRYEKVS